jgi:hypothetical protein
MPVTRAHGVLVALLGADLAISSVATVARSRTEPRELERLRTRSPPVERLLS